MTSTTTTRTTVVTEVPDERRWQGRDWVKALVAGGLALSLLRPGVTTAPVAQPTAVAVATPLPAVVATVVPTAGAVAPTAGAAGAVGTVEAPVVLSTREAVVAGPYEIRGTGAPGSLVAVLVNGAAVGTATVGADGRWTLPTTLEAGTAEIVAQTVDAAGAVLAEAAPVSLEVGEATAGGAAVVAPVVNAPPDDLIGGPAALTGTGRPGASVRVSVNGLPVGTTTVGPDGNWSLDTILSTGTQSVVAEEIDAGGLVVAASDPVEINVTGGLGVTLAEPAEGAELAPGPITMRGNGTPGTVLEILDGDRVLGETTVGADGTWTFEFPLEAGTSALSVREQGSDQILVRPVRVTVGEVAAPAAGCGEALAVGCQAWVTRAGGLQLRIRTAPAITSNNIITRLPIGTEMTLEEGPQAADGFNWWRVTTKGGTAGWVAGENLVTQPD